MQRQSHLGKVFEKSDQFLQRENDGGMPTMKGNIGPTSKFITDNKDFASQQKNLFSKMAEDFAIDKIIPDRELKNKSNEDIGYSNGSFNLSLHKDNQSNYNSSSDHHRSVPNKVNGVLDVPGMNNHDDSSGLVTSDSNFDMPGGDIPNKGEDVAVTKKNKDPKKDISKAFKKLLTKNN